MFGKRGREILLQKLQELPPQTAFTTMCLLNQIDALNEQIARIESRMGDLFEVTAASVELDGKGCYGYNGYDKGAHAMLLSVNIAELKNRLSAYLDLVRQGEEIIVRDRSRPIARIIPLSCAGDYDEEEQALIASGQLRPGSGRADPAFWTSFWSAPAPRIPARRAAEAVREDRDDG